jgi:hypothetical protein
MATKSCYIAAILSMAVIPLFAIVSPSDAAVTPCCDAQKEGRGLQVKQAELVGAWPRSAKRFALIIGVDEYLQDPQIGNLEGAGNDARALAEALIEYAGFPKDQVTILTCDQPPDRWPTRGNILRRLSNLRSTVPEDGLILVSFSGHGMERDTRAYLLPADAQISGDLGLLEDTAIQADQIKQRIRETGIGQVVIILDACRSDPAGGRARADNLLTEAYTRSLSFDARNLEVIAFATLFATEVGSRAYEYGAKKQGYFTWALVQGLKGAAANERGEVTLKSLVDYVQMEVPKRISIDLGASRKQRPFAVIEGFRADELVIAAPGNRTSATGRAGLPNADEKEQVFWDLIKDSHKPFALLTYLELYPNGHFAAPARQRLDTLKEIERKGREGIQHRITTFDERLQGTWDVNVSLPQGKRTFLLIIRKDTDVGQRDGGARQNSTRFLGAVGSKKRERPLSYISLNGHEITFVDTYTLNGKERNLKYTGHIDSDFVMTGEADYGDRTIVRWSAVQHAIY